MPEQYSRDDFAAQTGTQSQVFFDENNPTDAELTEVTERRQNEICESFALVFSTPTETPALNGIWKLEHAELGKLELGILPVAQIGQGRSVQRSGQKGIRWIRLLSSVLSKYLRLKQVNDGNRLLNLAKQVNFMLQKSIYCLCG